jgi:hypothetical protein
MLPHYSTPEDTLSQISVATSYAEYTVLRRKVLCEIPCNVEIIGSLSYVEKSKPTPTRHIAILFQLYPGVFIGHGAEWGLESIWALWRRKNLPLPVIATSSFRSASLRRLTYWDTLWRSDASFIYCSFNNAVSSSGYMALKATMHNELVRMWKEAVMT